MPRRVKQVLDNESIENLPLPRTGKREQGTGYKGLFIRVHSTGHKVFRYHYRLHGKHEAVTFAPAFPALSVEKAWNRAGEAAKLVADGKNPRHEWRNLKALPVYVNELIEEHYWPDAKAKNRASTLRNYRAQIDQHILPKIGTMAVKDVTDDDAIDIFNSVKATYTANRVISLGRRIFNHRMARKVRGANNNPFQGIERNPEESRQRYLSPKEMARLAESLDQHDDQNIADAIRLLILTGARKGEVLGVTWSQFDLDEGIWTKPSAHTKQKKEHRTPLSAPALQLLQGMPKAGDYLFPGRKHGTHLTEIKKSWDAIRQRAKLEDVRVHDLRHSFASTLASSGASLLIIGALLGHTQQQTTARYAHLYDDALREAADRVGTAFSNAGKPAEVTQLKDRTNG